jgi:hypothetical protein
MRSATHAKLRWSALEMVGRRVLAVALAVVALLAGTCAVRACLMERRPDAEPAPFLHN